MQEERKYDTKEAQLRVSRAGMRLLFLSGLYTSSLKLPVFPRLQFEIVCSLPHVVDEKISSDGLFASPTPG
jgi:hypothetical protein